MSTTTIHHVHVRIKHTGIDELKGRTGVLEGYTDKHRTALVRLATPLSDNTRIISIPVACLEPATNKNSERRKTITGAIGDMCAFRGIDLVIIDEEIDTYSVLTPYSVALPLGTMPFEEALQRTIIDILEITTNVIFILAYDDQSIRISYI